MTLRERWSEYRLEPYDRPKIRYEYFVSGRGEFPYDMLRHDSCWPASGEDAAKLHYGMEHREVRSIRMRSHRPPTVDRWSSFGWGCGTEKF